MKKKLLIVALIIGVLFSACTYLNHIQERNRANEAFVQYLAEASGCFVQDYSKIDDNQRNYYFSKASSNLYAAMAIKPYTSYDKVEKIYSLYQLYYLMSLNNDKMNNNTRIKLIEESGKNLYDILYELRMNPEDSEKWAELYELIKGVED